LRYIHQNPLKAGLCKEIDDYRYSSYSDYTLGKSDFVDIDYALSMIDKNTFVAFNSDIVNDKHLDCENEGYRINDTDAAKIIESISNCANTAEIQSLEVKQRDRLMKALRAKGLSIRQISRLTGISIAIVRRP